MNVGASSLSLIQARTRVREIQTKLHRWANDDAQRRFDDLLNLVADPASCLSHGTGCGATLGPARLAWTARPSATSSGDVAHWRS